MPSKDFQDGAPDLCIEIISPSEESAEMRQKIAEHFASGAQQVWHLFPETQRAIAYTSSSGAQNFGAGDEINAGDLRPDFHCRVSELFALD